MNLFLWITVFTLVITLVFGWGFLLWMIAEIGSKIFNIFGFFYTLISSFVTLKWSSGRKKINEYFYSQGLSKDQHSNVVLADLFNKIMLKRLSIRFGDPDETLSYYFAINKLIGDSLPFSCGLSRFGKFWSKFLNLFERKKGGHLNVSIERKMNKEIASLKKYSIDPDIDLDKYKKAIIAEFEKSI